MTPLKLRKRLSYALQRLNLAPATRPSEAGDRVEPAHTAEPTTAGPAEPTNRSAGSGPLDAGTVDEVLELLIRPALRLDGGDVALVRVEGLDIHVQLQGACVGCPSSTATLRDGIERILREEFPEMRELVHIG